MNISDEEELNGGDYDDFEPVSFELLNHSVDDNQTFRRGDIAWIKYSVYPMWPAYITNINRKGKFYKVNFYFIELEDTFDDKSSSKFRYHAKMNKNIFPFYTPKTEGFLDLISKTRYANYIEPVLKVCEHYLMLLALNKIDLPNSGNLPAFFTDYKQRIGSSRFEPNDIYKESKSNDREMKSEIENQTVDEFTNSPSDKRSKIQKPKMSISKIERQIIKFILNNDKTLQYLHDIFSSKNITPILPIDEFKKSEGLNFGPINSIKNQRKIFDFIYQQVEDFEKTTSNNTLSPSKNSDDQNYFSGLFENYDLVTYVLIPHVVVFAIKNLMCCCKSTALNFFKINHSLSNENREYELQNIDKAMKKIPKEDRDCLELKMRKRMKNSPIEF